MPQMFGWVNQPREVARVMGTLKTPYFGNAAAHLIAEDPRDTLLFDAELRLFGKTLPPHDQEIGDCVSHGTGRACDDTRLIDIVSRKEPEEFTARVATEAIYGMGRKGQGINGDGMVGAWGAEVALREGLLLRAHYQSGNQQVDLTQYSGRLAREWGNPRNGPPQWLYPIAAPHHCVTTALIRSAREGAIALSNGYGVACSSNLGFTMTRDARGMCRRSGTWMHCMAWRGYAVLKGNIPAILWQQSWGNSPTGNNRATLESGRDITLPEGSFFSDFETANLGARQGDTWVFGNVLGWRRRDLSWLAPAGNWN